MDSIKILVSNRALPSDKVGSWTTRMTNFVTRNPDFFNYVLSPNKSLVTSRYCKKRSFITWKKRFRKFQLVNWVALDYLKEIKKISKNYDKITVVVMDDLHLLEAISQIKKGIKCELELVLSFHGFNLSLDQKLLSSINKILFLSKTGYEFSKKSHKFFPKGIIIGNAINSNIFYPLDDEQFEKKRQEKGFSETDKVLIWMANDRPRKGFHIFKAVAEKLLTQNKNLKILIIGTTQTINHINVETVGRLPNNEIAAYLQLGDYYMFTTLYEEGFGLSMVEAYKCGNTVLASKLGAIPEVLHGLTNTFLIEDPNVINNWVKCLNDIMIKSTVNHKRLSVKAASTIWDYEDWETKFIKSIQ
ncbi:mannosyltransferase [Flavobacteriales bacterium ALC-1]|nr:mannosyltransferase [Flavobacteriales bacterium ALC-1]